MKPETTEIFNRLLWTPEYKSQLPDIFVSYRHRGTENDEATIPFSEIQQLEGNGFRYTSLSEFDLFIPMHRVLKIWNSQSGEIFYQKPSGAESDD